MAIRMGLRALRRLLQGSCGYLVGTHELFEDYCMKDINSMGSYGHLIGTYAIVVGYLKTNFYMYFHNLLVLT